MSDQGNSTSGASAWFPYGRQDLPGWRFDVITLLAVIGESSVAEHAQTLTASSLCLLPRLIPAPQALLRAGRPQRLPEVTAKMAGVYGGVVLDTVGFFANIMHPLEELKPFAFRVLEIKHAHLMGKREGREGREVGGRGWVAGVSGLLTRRRKSGKGTTTGSGEDGEGSEKVEGGKTAKTTQTVHFAADDPERGLPPPSTAAADSNNGDPKQPADPGIPGPRRAPTMSEKITDLVTNPTIVTNEERYTVPPALYSPVHLLSVFSFLLTIANLVAAGIWIDGTAILAVGLVSLAGTVICYASWWRPILMHRRTTNKVPKGDVVIRTREGAFVLIRCTEEVARELYSGTEECRYVSSPRFHRAFMGAGMVLLMVSVVLLGNCGWNSQVFVGGSYIVLNGLYWLTGLLPPRYFWDLSRYDVRDVTPEDARRADQTTDENDPREGAPSFTRTLWYAVRETRHGAWVERSGALPGTEQWRAWLKEAVAEAWKGNAKWEAVRRKNEIMKEALDASSPTSLRIPVDEAEQRAPLLEVQPRRREGLPQVSSTF